MSNYVKLNIGGIKTVLNKNIIASIPYIENLIHANDTDDHIFIDMNYEHFVSLTDKIKNKDKIENNHLTNYLCVDTSDQCCEPNEQIEGLINHYTYENVKHFASASEYIELYGIGSISYKNKFEIVRNGDVIDNIFVKLVLNESMIYRPSLGIKNVSLIIGGVTHYTCSGKYLEFINHCKKSDVHYLKIPAFHGKNSSLPSFALQYHCVELFIEFNNLDNIKDVALNVRYIYLNDIPRRKISQNLNLILINNPVDVDKENIDNKSIKFDIDVRSNIRDLYLICDNVSSVSFYCDDIIIWKHSNFLLNTIIPKNLLNTKLPFNHYYYSFSANGDMKCLEGYYKLVDKKNCYIIVELNSNVKVKAWLLYHQVYNCSICEGVGSISQVE